eukprot:CAMPEP_0195655626 /NCGR_PEP_ID=MMETSP0815-20121206/34562_1 /TAXON_ID=97485 /ORGANISM="Prymnesium parvum, Strain Texoma1" /LENGTH=142 /DNA_ID=CAMNT_0040799933 /DNA_START=364 /DNA_END=794 /DNA_ORIENTATION=+
MELDRPFGATPTPTSLLSPTLALALEALEAFEADETLLDAPRMCSLPPWTRRACARSRPGRAAHVLAPAQHALLRRGGAAKAAEVWLLACSVARPWAPWPNPTGHYVDGTELDDKGHASMLFVAIQGQLSGQHKTTPWNSPT